jgi:hypothetical protein
LELPGDPTAQLKILWAAIPHSLKQLDATGNGLDQTGSLLAFAVYRKVSPGSADGAERLRVTYAFTSV